MKLKIADKKRVKRRLLLLASTKKDGWVLQFSDSTYPFGYFFNDGVAAREAFETVGSKMVEDGGDVSVVLEESRFAGKKRCPRDHVEIRGRCYKTRPTAPRNFGGEASVGTSTGMSAPTIARIRKIAEELC